MSLSLLDSKQNRTKQNKTNTHASENRYPLKHTRPSRHAIPKRLHDAMQIVFPVYTSLPFYSWPMRGDVVWSDRLLDLPIQELLSDDRPRNDETHEWEIAIEIIQSAVVPGNQWRKVGKTHNIAASPSRLACLPQSPRAAFCVVGMRSNGCGSKEWASVRTRVAMLKARRWATILMIGDMVKKN